MSMSLTAEEQAWRNGEAGEGRRVAIELLTRLGDAMGARRFVPITSAHVDGCLYQGRASLDFVRRIVASGSRVAVPTTLNVGSLDLVHPQLFHGDEPTRQAALELMESYVALGCRPTWTCAPYQIAQYRPRQGEQIAWAESNAVVFANSVLGARTNRYGDFTDVCAAIAGRVPEYGLHLPENRCATVLVRVGSFAPHWAEHDVFFALLGLWIGSNVGERIPVINGLPWVPTEDQFKALGAAAASSGSVALIHVVGVTPEARSLGEACAGREPELTLDFTLSDLISARDSLITGDGDLVGVSVGTPHFSLNEFEALVTMLDGRHIRESLDFFVSTSRAILEQARERGLVAQCERAGLTLVADTCTYVTRILEPKPGVVMTNSAKWAYYAPGNIGVKVAFASLRECVESAIAGTIWRDDELWSNVSG